MPPYHVSLAEDILHLLEGPTSEDEQSFTAALQELLRKALDDAEKRGSATVTDGKFMRGGEPG